MLGAHLRPIGIQFLGHECGEAGERALAELDVFNQHGDEIVSTDAKEGIGCKARSPPIRPEGPRDARLGARGGRQMEAKDKPRNTLDGGAACKPDVSMGSHGFNPPGASRRRESQRGCGHRSRSGRDCRSWQHRCRDRLAA